MADERVVPGTTSVHNVQKHIARYNLALEYCVGKDVIDIACGSGYGTYMLSWVADWVRGYDIDEESIDRARSTYHGKKHSFEVADLSTIDVKPADTVVCFETIEHLKDLENTKQQLLRLAKTGGHLVYSLPLNEQEGFNEHHFHTFTEQEAFDLFSDQEVVFASVQMGVNFNPPKIYGNQFSYFVGVVKKL